MDPYPTHQPAYALQRPYQSTRPPLPGWSRAFRMVLIILGGVIAFLLLLFLGVSMATEPSFYTESGKASIKVSLGLGLVILLLSVPYVLASVVYAVLWASSLRGRGYRSHPGTAWFLVLGPIAIIVPVLVWVSL